MAESIYVRSSCSQTGIEHVKIELIPHALAGGWPTLPSSFENPEGAPSKLRLGGLVAVAISRSTPKIPHLFFITNAQ